MKKLLYIPLMFILFTSFNVVSEKSTSIGSVTTYSFVVYDNVQSIKVNCKIKEYRTGGKIVSVDPEFYVYEEISQDSTESQSNCFPVFNEAQVVSKRINSQISFEGKINKAIATNGYVFYGTSQEIFVLDIATMHFSSFYSKKEGFYDFAVVDDKLYLATNEGLEIIGTDTNKKLPFSNPIISIKATTGKKQIIITEKGTQEKKRILRTKDLKEKIIIKNPTLLTNLIDITKDNNGLTYNSDTKTLALYNLKKELKIKDYIIPEDVYKEIKSLKKLGYNKNEVIIRIVYKLTGNSNDKYKSETKRINITTNSIRDIQFQLICDNSYETKITR